MNEYSKETEFVADMLGIDCYEVDERKQYYWFEIARSMINRGWNNDSRPTPNQGKGG
jgi:tRNA U34 2-thiouridine synthase MnmA/TrmU